MSGWTSRFNNLMSGRYSPFGGPTRENGVNGTNEVTDQDFSYITADDLAAHSSSNHHSHSYSPNGSRDKDRVPRDTDLLIFRNRNVQYPIHFPAYSITDGILTLGAAREQVARKLDVHPPRRIRMIWKGRNLKDDSRTLRDEGLRSTDEAEILCVIGDAASDGRDDGSDSGSEASVDGRADGDAVDGKTRKKRKSRSNKKKKTRKSGVDIESGSGTSSPIPVAEHLPIPSSAHPLHRTSATPTAAPRGVSPQPPQTPLAKLAAIEDKFRTELKPAAEAYMANPPSDRAKSEFEHKKHAEMILAQIILKCDGVETEGDDDARAKRRALVKDVQAFLTRLDAFVK